MGFWENLKAKKRKGIFYPYFIGNYIQNAEDLDDFTVFYEDRAMALIMSGFLGVKMDIQDHKVVGTYKEKSETLTFTLTPNQDNSEAFENDIDSLIAYEDFLIGVGSEIFEFEKVAFSNFADLCYFTINYIMKSNRLDDFARSRFRGKMQNSRRALSSMRKNVKNIDQDIVLSTAHTGIGWVEGVATSHNISKNISWHEIRSNMKEILSCELDLPLDNRNELRQAHAKTTPGNLDDRLFAYVRQRKNIEAHPEMW